MVHILLYMDSSYMKRLREKGNHSGVGGNEETEFFSKSLIFIN